VGYSNSTRPSIANRVVNWVQFAAAASYRLAVNEDRYENLLGEGIEKDLPPEHALGRVHTNPKVWMLTGGWHNRQIRPTDPVHPSVLHRIAATANDAKPYRPDLNR
jgi:hypothetical protein